MQSNATAAKLDRHYTDCNGQLLTSERIIHNSTRLWKPLRHLFIIIQGMKEHGRKGDVLRSLVSLNIRRFRRNVGLSQEELAERANISVPYIGALERGEKWPSPGTFVGLAQGLGIEPHDLMRPEGTASREVKQVIDKLITDINTLVNNSLNTMMNTVAQDNDKLEN